MAIAAIKAQAANVMRVAKRNPLRVDNAAIRVVRGTLHHFEEPEQRDDNHYTTEKRGLQLQASPSGSVYLAEGRTSPVQYLNQLVQVRGQIHAGPTGKKFILTIDRLELVDQSCASAKPAQKSVAVVGKVGEGQMAVPVTTSASADQTTPGFQTEGMVKQEPPASSRATPIQRWTAKYAPGNIAQAAQSAAIAEIYAASVTRTEIVPGHTLGVDTMPDYSAAVENKSSAKAPRQR